MEDIKTNHLNSSYIGQTRGTARSDDASYDKAETVEYESYLQSFWPDYNPSKQGYSHHQTTLKERNYRILDTHRIISKPPTCFADKMENHQLRSRWNEMMGIAKGLVTLTELEELINEQDERKRELL